MIARLFGVPPEKKESETSSKPNYDAFDTYRNNERSREHTLVGTLEPETVLDEKGLKTPQKVSENYFPSKGMVTMGVLMSVIGLLLYLPVKLPSIYRYIGGICFFIMGISVIGSEILNSRKNRARALV
jgi:hypothetical protein